MLKAGLKTGVLLTLRCVFQGGFKGFLFFKKKGFLKVGFLKGVFERFF